MNATAVDSAAELAELLRARGHATFRLCGAASRQDRWPGATRPDCRLSLHKLQRIERLEPDDLTCSVQPGLPCAELAAALQAKGLELEFLHNAGGTVGGAYAVDPTGAAAPGAATPRTTLLGIEAVLGDGTAFKAGSRVVKSVAGFDVHKLFVGSRGLLFAATLLHLKLRPRPRARVDFATAASERAAAVPTFLALRQTAPGPTAMLLRQDATGTWVEGSLAGRASWVESMLRQHGLRAVAAAAPMPFEAAGDREVVAGLVRPGRCAALLTALPATARALVTGAGRFEVEVPRAHTDALLAALPALAAEATIVGGADDRRGRGTPRDEGVVRLERALKLAFDPRGVLV